MGVVWAPLLSGWPGCEALRGNGRASEEKDGPHQASPKVARQLAASTVRDQFQVLNDAAHGCDLVVGATALQIVARSIAESRKIPYVFVAYCPTVLPAADHHPVPKRGLRYPPWLPSIANRVPWKVDDRLVNTLFLATLNEGRAKLRLANVDRVQRHVFTDRPWLAADPMLGPGSFRTRLNIVQTGAWFLPDERPQLRERESRRRSSRTITINSIFPSE